MLRGLFLWYSGSASFSSVSVLALLLFVCAVFVAISLSWDGSSWVSEEKAPFGSRVSVLHLAVGEVSFFVPVVLAIVLVLAWSLVSVQLVAGINKTGIWGSLVVC
jgi:hypothetical protein